MLAFDCCPYLSTIELKVGARVDFLSLRSGKSAKPGIPAESTLIFTITVGAIDGG
eukprot:SAG22_NODE_437_length_10501_cov_3.019804_5_plen_55_part_00